ncbi:hypothetical protein [Haloplanus halophilus]|uniref:hypothetical protein n=1 Tax=Haloplanus halophilus TaxID=2949993 RepID=UPI00203C3D15|nr:hypothetical protein [Haloplanus sp. GDY1]
MSKANPSPTTGDTTDNCTDYTTKLLPQHVYLGRDREGYVHHLDRDANAVHRVEDAGERERVTPLGDAHLDDYLAFVADEIGWTDRKQAATWDFFGRDR